jgi:hypothetical protein
MEGSRQEVEAFRKLAVPEHLQLGHVLGKLDLEERTRAEVARVPFVSPFTHIARSLLGVTGIGRELDKGTSLRKPSR